MLGKGKLHTLVGNTNGKLVSPGQGYLDTCKDLSLAQTGVLSVMARTKDKKWVPSTIDLNKVLGTTDAGKVIKGKDLTKNSKDLKISVSGVITCKVKDAKGTWFDAEF